MSKGVKKEIGFFYNHLTRITLVFYIHPRRPISIDRRCSLGTGSVYNYKFRYILCKIQRIKYNYLICTIFAAHGCCAKCCLKFPWPSIISFFVMIISVFSFLAAVHVGGSRTKQYFQSTGISEQLNKWIDSITITVYCVVGFMFVIAIMLLGVGYLSTGSTRSSYVCRFKNRKSGRCQTKLVGSGPVA